MHTLPPSEQVWDTVWTHARLASMREGHGPFGLLEDATIAVSGETIAWLGSTHELPKQQLASCNKVVDCAGDLVTPGLIDCHTHLVHGGNRASEFEMRLNGASYAEIAAAGGGIISTVSATREASELSLYQSAAQRLQHFMREGVTTVEIKSGYGLDLENELKMLRVARQLGERLPLDVQCTFLGAHATPIEYDGRSDDYIEAICEQILPAVAQAGLADAVDAFCENIAFTREQVRRVFRKAQEFNLPIKLHAEQLSDQTGAVLAADMGALSVDHLEYLAEQDVAHIKRAGTTAVLLPGAFYFLRETQLPPIDALRAHQVPIAIASDSNPGSSPVSSLLLMLNMACTLFKLTPEEALAGVTRNAAKALGLSEQVGTLELGKTANMVRWESHNPAELSYGIGHNPCRQVMYRGQIR